MPVESASLGSKRLNDERPVNIPLNPYNVMMNPSNFGPSYHFNQPLMQYIYPDNPFARSPLIPVGILNTQKPLSYRENNYNVQQNSALRSSHNVALRTDNKEPLKKHTIPQLNTDTRTNIKMENQPIDETPRSTYDGAYNSIALSCSPIRASQNIDYSSMKVRIQDDTEESRNKNDVKVSSTASLKFYPRVKHFRMRVEADKKQMDCLEKLNHETIENNDILSFEMLSSYYPTIRQNQNKRCSSTMSSSSTSSSPATIPNIAEESAEKENKRPKTSTGEGVNEAFTNLNILCEAVNIVTVKNKQEHELKHSIAMRNLVRSKTCSCPRSRCIKLYCECFQEGRLCSKSCSCKKCKNTQEETGPHGLRTKAINGILSRNPHAFSNSKTVASSPTIPSHGILCRCVKSQCLKLYCDCFQSGEVCGSSCVCINCLNTSEESGKYGKRTLSRNLILQRNPDAFKPKIKSASTSCSCRNNRCLKKYCDCFNSEMACSSLCKCKDCANLTVVKLKGEAGLY